MARHIEQFWHKSPDWIETDYGRVAGIECPIDTTFAPHRAGEPFVRLKLVRQVYHPYEARHLDWYHDSISFRSQAIFNTASADISHWNNHSSYEEFATHELTFNKFIYVEDDENEMPVEKVQSIE